MKNIFKVLEILLASFVFNVSCGSSWQSYVDEQLIAQGISQGAILGLGGSTLAHSPGGSPKAGELQKIAGDFANPGNFFATAVTYGGVKYLTIKADHRSVYGKKGAGGIVAVKTKQNVVVGVYDEKLQPGKAALIVEKLADHLVENGH